jgi:hypothetical protein
MGIEPTSPAWKAGALPLCYARYLPPRERLQLVDQRAQATPPLESSSSGITTLLPLFIHREPVTRGHR